MPDRGMLCPVCDRWVTGMGPTTTRMPNHRDPRKLGVSCGGVNRPPKETRGFEK